MPVFSRPDRNRRGRTPASFILFANTTTNSCRKTGGGAEETGEDDPAFRCAMGSGEGSGKWSVLGYLQPEIIVARQPFTFPASPPGCAVALQLFASISLSSLSRWRSSKRRREPNQTAASAPKPVPAAIRNMIRS